MGAKQLIKETDSQTDIQIENMHKSKANNNVFNAMMPHRQR